MNSQDAKPGWSGVFGPMGAGAGSAAHRPARRRFRPTLTSLEDRQLLSAATISTDASLNGPNQGVVGGLVMDAQGDLFGTASSGGEVSNAKGDATVFEIPEGSKKAVTLASFDGSKGYGISGVSLDAQGDLYGTFAGEGGAFGDGSVFELARGSKVVTTLATFNGSNGMFPDGVVPDAQGNLYGTTAVGGASGAATAYEIAKGSGTITPLATFPGAGSAPKDLAVDAQGNLYGTNAAGGTAGAGSVFEIAKGSGAVTTLASFHHLDGAGVSRVILDGQGDLYGTTEDGGEYGAGSVFEIARGSDAVTTLASFDTLDGSGPDPVAGLAMDARGNLYGTTEAGGANGDGTVFELAQGSGTITPIAAFTSSNGALVSGLVLDGQGDLIGSMDGSGSGGGNVFKIAPAPAPASPMPASVETTTTTVIAEPEPAAGARPSKPAVAHHAVAKSHQALMKQKLGEVSAAVVKKG